LKFTPQSIPDVILIEPTIFGDNRGYFAETFRQDLLNENIEHKINFVQDNESKSSKGVLRGLHYQVPPFSQAKLVRVINGSVLDVVLDVRKSSKSFGQHISFELNDKNRRQLFVPHGFAHGFVVLSDSATFAYKVDKYYAPEYDRGIAYDDLDLAIDWKLPRSLLKLSEKDKKNPTFSNAKDLFV
jgi:dTDP-4-dehydrorhamnose 3,5-epimerase